ncbi:SdiA-regulated domain-containing protein [uncultured Algibacter sp.]|uniref:SdiA-regulated domain-containing protein n=1 Tax=uncultured Algibacter sp. TaxID=298659 RepID=UPI0026209076|nr:SdiA-regulated domain-containing protein [uncultured Algibacter sp.]
MTFTMKSIFILVLLLLSCNTGSLDIIAEIDNDVDESSALEIVKGSDLLWTIEDAGNKNYLFGLNQEGKVQKKIKISNAKNIDWEDLTSDDSGNIYIGDFGNNSKKRDKFTIYKVKVDTLTTNKTTAKKIHFKIPKNLKSEDFESFFLLNNTFYIFSKNQKKSLLLKVPNKIGSHKAKLITKFKLDGKQTKVTAAAISPNKKVIVLLNHDKLWKITNFKSENFFKGDIERLDFNHNSQKEGICFKDKNTVYISDERSKAKDSYIYSYKLNDNK